MVGLTVVNALSEWLEAEVRRNGQIWRQSYQKGEPQATVSPEGSTKTTGTTIRFLPDAEIFPRIDLDFDVLEKRLRELAFLYKAEFGSAWLMNARMSPRTWNFSRQRA